MMGGQGTGKAATTGGKQVPDVFSQMGSSTGTPSLMKTEPQVLPNTAANDMQAAITMGGNGAQIPIMGNSEAGVQQGMKTAQSSPAQLFRQLSPSSIRGNVGGGK